MSEWDSGLIIEGVEITEIDGDSLRQALEALYELTYKYDQIDLHKWSGEDPKSEDLAITEAGVREMAEAVAGFLVPVFEDWLDVHALTDPHTWALKRWNEEGMEELGYVDEDAVTEAAEALVNEYGIQLAGGVGSRAMEQRRWARNKLDHEIEVNLDKMPELKRFLEAVAEDEYNSRMEDYDPEVDDKPEKLPPEEALSGYGLDFEELAKMAYENFDAWKIIHEVAEHVVFPVWFARWKSKGIVATRRRVERATDKLREIAQGSMAYTIAQLSKEINLLINTAHQTGSMLDYIEQRYSDQEITTEFLDDLSNADTTPWDEELAEMGVEKEVDVSRVVRRRAQEEARSIVRQAWKDLAAAERGARNPRMSLQEAVIRRLEGV